MAGWDNFYVIVGSSAAAIIGVQFVVIALIAGLRAKMTADSISAFATPSVVHLTSALVLSAVMTAPWPSLFSRGFIVALWAAGGLVYATLVVRRARRQSVYAPVLEDWVWHGILPSVSYAALLVGALALRAGAPAAFVIAGSALGLLLVGIHNAWDTVTHMLVTSRDAGRHDPH